MGRRERIVGILLAAGASRRMGSPKALLPFGTGTVLEECVARLHEGFVERVIVVLGSDAERIRVSLPTLFAEEGVEAVFNERHASGMLSSVQCGVRAADADVADGFLLSLLDQPFVRGATIRAVVEAFRSTERRIVVPTFGGQRGHPICLAASLRDAILALGNAEGGLRTLIRQREDETLLLPVDSDEVLRDMDTPEDYQRELNRWMNRIENS